MTKYKQISSLLALCCAANSAYPQTRPAKINLTPDSTTARDIESITVLGRSNTNGGQLGGADLNSLAINSHVVGQAELERLQFVDPNELLDRIPGETQVRNLRIPNGSKGYTIPMLDGIPLENPYEGATQRLDRTNTFDIQRIEVIKGPASALYPNNAFGGVVNVVSRDAPLEPQTKLFLETGNFNRLRAGVSTGGRADKVGYFVDVNTRNLDGLREDSVNDRDQLSSKLSYTISDMTKIVARLEYFDEYVVARGDLTAEEIEQDKTQAGSLRSSTDLQQNSQSLKIEHMLSTGLLSIDWVRREKDTIGLSRFSGPQDENDLGYNTKLMYRHDFSQSNLIGGYSRYSGTQQAKQYDRQDTQLTGSYLEFENQRDIDAYFVQYQFDASPNIQVTTGARYEDIHIDSSIYNQPANFSDIAPKLGITYQISPNNMLWVGISEGFYAPNTNDLFDSEEGNPDLKPEEAVNSEIGLRGSFTGAGGKWQYDTSIYHNEITNYLVTQEFIHPNGDEYLLTTNAGQVTIKGLETVVEYLPDNGIWSVGITHTYTDNRYDVFVQSSAGAADDLSGKILSRSPKHHLNGRIAWLPSDSLSIELEGDFYSHYYADLENSAEAIFTRKSRINLRINYQMEHWRLWLHGLNLTDTLKDRATYNRGQMKFRTVDGRIFYAGLSYTF